ncbi:lysozyme inhibitor LprI family protein [Rhodanobacter sp. Col0626]|uniref:lysozyme inhibitor LprI family protein n=1 Tax=Rhodanobacter sp. Col0626 TaxID=3415679 RepID=UPI003CE84F74
MKPSMFPTRRHGITRRLAAWPTAALLLAMNAPVLAANCDSANNTVQMNACMADEVKAADLTLNHTYQRVLATLNGADSDQQQSYPASTKAALIEAERAWVKYRDADCKAVYNHWKGGTIRTSMELGCRQERAEQRTRQLEAFLEKP